MFTGIIESLGTIKRIESSGQGKVLSIACSLDLSETRVGDSIAVNGACLTAVRLNKNEFSVDMAPETVERTTFKHLTTGSRVNIERALKLSDRIDGHLVSGHIDGTGVISSIVKKSNAVIIAIQVSETLADDLIEKGSVAIDGISLTINRCSKNDFEISIIPHTAQMTTIGLKKAGDEVNLETDMIGKYVKKILRGSSSKNDASSHKKTDISMELLARNGFL
ncbi:MAG: riboflavin synthase [Proteobacteria bacterium]|nr:riboflavin synthase [Pseudomonadota bacterium]MBU1389284.1 riboflavin synthase [Pseudomonadota bacterium]MBU1544104.1 riboflavin synthase [Pseudomonadota bacterium]MBU2431378.1 riboflavin synthase [Pseudomonadota bacterium]MBU2481636.1 riboflavin synthase [Pseudomonadota bacterium]